MFFKKKRPDETRPVEPQGSQIGLSEEDGPKAAFMAMVLERTGRERALALLKVALVCNMILLIALCCVFYFGVIYKRNVFFATTPDGRIQELVPLDQPYVSTAGIANWTAQAVTETFTLDFRNWRRTLARVRHFYSKGAWEQLERDLKPLIETIEKERLSLYAITDEAPRLLAEGKYTKDLYAWRMEFPMTLTHQLLDGTKTFKWNVQVLAGRANIAEKPDGVEILQIVIVPR